MEHDRLNSPSTSVITLEAFGHQLQFSQDPNSKHLGTTVWDASIVLVKYLEKNCRRGKFSPSKLKGKRVIELGAGCGVAAFGMALLGCNAVATDQKEVLPLLKRNVEQNTWRILQMDCSSDSFGSVQVAELDWGNEYHIKAVDPPFDFVIGTDVVYAEHLLEPLLRIIFALSGTKTTILVGYEIRSTNVHDQMLDMWRRNFEVKIVPKAKMDNKYQHPSIQLYVLEQKPTVASKMSTSPTSDLLTDEQTGGRLLGEDETVGTSEPGEKLEECNDEKVEEVHDPMLKFPHEKLTEWEARRLGSMAARLLKDVTIQ